MKIEILILIAITLAVYNLTFTLINLLINKNVRIIKEKEIKNLIETETKVVYEIIENIHNTINMVLASPGIDPDTIKETRQTMDELDSEMNDFMTKFNKKNFVGYIQLLVFKDMISKTFEMISKTFDTITEEEFNSSGRVIH